MRFRFSFLKLFVMGLFNKSDFYYDPISGLTLTTFQKSPKFGDITEGYVNQEGVFMIIKGEASKW